MTDEAERDEVPIRSRIGEEKAAELLRRITEQENGDA